MTHPCASSEDELRQHLAAIVESSHDAITSTDLHGVVTSWNAGAEWMYGYTATEAIGLPITVLIPDGHRNEIPMILERLRRGERITHYETVRQTKDGRCLDVSLTVSPIRNNQGQVVGTSAAARDITEHKQAVRLLQQLNETLEQRVAERTAEAQSRADQLQRLAGELADVKQRERRRLAHLLHDDL